MAPFLCLGDLPLVGRLPRFQLALFCIFCICIFCIFGFFVFSIFSTFSLPSVTPPWAENPDTEGLQVEYHNGHDCDYQTSPEL